MNHPEPGQAAGAPLVWTDELVGRFWAYYARSRQEDYFTYRFGDRILALTRRYIPAGATVADYGCGAGHLLERLLTTHRAAGLDYTTENVEAVRARLQHNRNLEGVFVIGRDEPGDSRYDAIYFVETVEHVLPERLDLTVRMLRALLRPGGIIVVTTPNDEDLEALRVFCPQCQRTFHAWQHQRSFNAASLTRFMTEHDFEPVQTFTTDFAARTLVQRAKARLRPLAGRKNPHLVFVGRRPAR